VGTVIGVAVSVLESAEVPAAFVAVNDTVYSVPFVNKVIVHVVADAPAVHTCELS
jgi:hypothetical protein